MLDAPKKRIRCAIYTRKSTEEGLEQEFNSLDNQREAAENYIMSQRHEGWMLLPDYYDDGGFSGGTLERPALKRLMRDIERGEIDAVVVYKVDRLSRSLTDFAKLVDVFDRHQVSFVSVTQQFSTTTSMGRLTLNILLSFAQFEREVIGERVRDKIAASKRKGMWMGGYLPLGYDVVERKLIVNEEEAKQVRHIFNRFVTLKSATALATELRSQGMRTKSFMLRSGKPKPNVLISKAFIYKLLNNRIYIGEITHKDKNYPGQHEAIISKALWNDVHSILQVSPRTRANETRIQTPALLRGLALCGGCQAPMTPTSTRKKGKQYSYYACSHYLALKSPDCRVARISADQLEGFVFQQIKPLVQTPELIAQTWQAIHENDPKVTEQQVRNALLNFEGVWGQLFPAEQRRVLELLLSQIQVFHSRVDISVNTDSLGKITQELLASQSRLQVVA